MRNLKSSITFFPALLLLAVVAFACQPSGQDNPAEKQTISTGPPSTGGLKVAYINTDTILSRYDMVKDLEEDLLQEKMMLEGRLKRQVEQLEKEYQYAQKEAPNLPADKLQALQMEFAQKEQNLMLEKQELESQLMRSEQSMNENLYKNLQDFLKRYSEREGYDFIFGYNTIGDVMFAAPKFNITEVVIDSLNTQYNLQKDTAKK